MKAFNDEFNGLIQLLQQPKEFYIEIEMEEFEDEGNGDIDDAVWARVYKLKRPKITNNRIKLIKIL